MTAEGGVRRRELLVGGALLAGAGVLTAEPARAATSGARELPTLTPTDDWPTVLASTKEVQLVPGAQYVLSSTVDLPTGCRIVGNGAEVTVASTSLTAFTIASRARVTITDLRLTGQATDPINTGIVTTHVGIRMSRSSDVRIEGCDFMHWRGAAVAITGSDADTYYRYRTKVIGNSFNKCFLAVSIADRSEYGILADNHFTHCRLAIWNSSGNWLTSGNVVVGCYGAYYAIGRSSPYGSQSSDNWNHGAVVGNVVNHASSGAGTRWTSNVAFVIGGVSRDPGSGVVVEGVTPPTFTGNTLWDSDITGHNLGGTRWLLSGCTISGGTVSCTGDDPLDVTPIHLSGTQSARSSPPTLGANVVDLHPYSPPA